MSILVDITGQLVIDYRSREWCKLSYPNHPRGCPNYNHKPTCPPKVCQIEDFVDLEHQLWLVIEPFDLLTHITNMKSKLPSWSERQLRCVLYWQSGVNKRLREACMEQATSVGGIFTICPEAMGVQVIKTAKRIGLPISPRPKDWVFKVGLIGMAKK